MIVGRVAWEETNTYHTPWFSFRTRTEFQNWARDMRKAIGGNTRKLRSEYFYVDAVWRPDTLLAETKRRNTRLIK